MLKRQQISLGIFFALLLCFVGCGTGDGLNRQAVSGNITWDGKPLETGRIRFEPLSTDVGVIGAAKIKHGKYTIDQAIGLVPGEYRVSIISPKTPPASQNSQDKDTEPSMDVISPPVKERIPKCYNSNTTLKKTITDGGENRVDFNLVKEGK